MKIVGTELEFSMAMTKITLEGSTVFKETFGGNVHSFSVASIGPHLAIVNISVTIPDACNSMCGTFVPVIVQQIGPEVRSTLWQLQSELLTQHLPGSKNDLVSFFQHPKAVWFACE